MGLYMGGLYTGGGLIYGQHLMLVIIFIAPVHYTGNEKKYKHTVCNDCNLYKKKLVNIFHFFVNQQRAES